VARRVLILDENFSVPSDRRVWQEARTLTRSGVHVTVVSPTGMDRDHLPYERLGGVDIHRFTPRPAEGGLAGYAREYGTALAAMRRLTRRLSAESNFDVVHACNPPDLLLLSALSARRAGAAFVFDHHDLVPELFRSRFGGGASTLLYAGTRVAEQVAFRLADVVIATNESYRRIAVTRGRKSPSDVYVVRNGPELANLPEPRHDSSWRGDRPYLIAYAGIMGPQDGVDHALRALQRLAEIRTDWRAVLAGEGDVLPEMRELARTLGLGESVQFPGWLDTQRLSSLLASADVCLAPDPSNPLNDRSTMVKVMDYMAHARPIATYDLPETRHSAGDAAAYAEPNDPDDLARIVDELLSDAERRETLGARGRARVETELAWEHSEPELLAAYERAFEIADARRAR
jgi:glycosyltransferase involved in cell wall biosynthesis